MLTTTLLTVNSQTVFYAKQQIWLSYLLVAAVILVPLWLLAKVLARFPGCDLFQAMVNRFPIIGRIISGLYILFFYFILLRDLRVVTDFTKVVLLATTPLAVIAFLIAVSAIFLAYGGIEVLARATEVYGMLLLLVIALLPVVLFREYDMSLATPFLVQDQSGMLIGSWFLFPYLGEILGIAFIFGKRSLRFTHGLAALLIGTVALISLAAQSVLVLGVPIMSRMLYPTYELVRQIQVTDFLDRFDLPLVGVWFPVMITKIGYSLYIVCNGIKRTVPGTTGQRMVFPFGLLAFVCSIWFFENSIQLFNLNRVWPIVSALIVLLIPVLLFVVLKPKARTQKEEENSLQQQAE